ncbi:MAG: endonuclease/exonuclease/phosphatase family protein [Gemmatimonadaceae bacterium]
MSLPSMILLAITVVLACATLLPLWRNPAWWVRAAEFPRLQVAVLLFATLLLTLLLVSPSPLFWAMLAAQVACLVYHITWIVPYSPLFSLEVKDARAPDAGRQLRILTANVLASNRDASRLLALVKKHQPDILVTLESDAWWEEQLASIEDEHPHTIKCALDNLYGMHVFSRLPLSGCSTEFLVEDDVPSMHAMVTLRSGERVRAHFLHPAPPSPTENAESTERDAELIVVGRSVAEYAGPVVVTGDLNDVAWSATTRLFRKLSGLLDPRIGRGMFNTFHAGHWFLRWPLDHVFHSVHFTLRHVERMPSIGSDHFPLLTELALEPARAHRQAGLEANEEERAWGYEITKNKDVTVNDLPALPEPAT